MAGAWAILQAKRGLCKPDLSGPERPHSQGAGGPDRWSGNSKTDFRPAVSLGIPSCWLGKPEHRADSQISAGGKHICFSQMPACYFLGHEVALAPRPKTSNPEGDGRRTSGARLAGGTAGAPRPSGDTPTGEPSGYEVHRATAAQMLTTTSKSEEQRSLSHVAALFPGAIFTNVLNLLGFLLHPEHATLSPAIDPATRHGIVASSAHDMIRGAPQKPLTSIVRTFMYVAIHQRFVYEVTRQSRRRTALEIYVLVDFVTISPEMLTPILVHTRL